VSARTTFAISPEVQAVLARCEVGADRVTLPPEQLDRKLYEGVIKVLGEYGAKWSRSAKAILFPPASREKLLAALGKGEVVREKVVRQAFYTPPGVADRLVSFASDLLRTDTPSRPLRVLEPSAGGGALIDAFIRYYTLRELYVTAVELDADAAAMLTRKYETGGRVTVLQSDFLTVLPDGEHLMDCAALNPPFTRGQALKHVTHALSFLAPGGVLAAVVPPNFPAAVGDAEFTELEIPRGAFKESGAGIATKLIRWRRPQ